MFVDLVKSKGYKQKIMSKLHGRSITSNHYLFFISSILATIVLVSIDVSS